MGAIDEATRYLEDLEKNTTEPDKNPLIMLLRGLLLIAKGEYFSSIEKFQFVMSEKWDQTLYSSSLRAEYLISAAIDLSMAYLHCTQPEKAAELIENLIHKNPILYFTEETVDALCVLYDLIYTENKSKIMKNVLKKTSESYNIYISPEIYRF